ncbi:MAG: hypothetical protein A2W00_08965 [Candidatus Eisenbacteria bacterium RBG_16_71_46]|nr:MAG: hypothetical protein A2W00_08965 [Candidatus Eisenbacteria bacterium RBG_16_71_46]
MTDRELLPDPMRGKPRLAMGPEDVARAPRESLASLLADLAALQTAVAARLAVAAAEDRGQAHGAGPDEMLTAELAARRTGMSRRQLYKRARAGELPFARRVSARSVRFSARGIERWLTQKSRA